MNFNQFNYWPGLLLLFILFSAIVLISEKRFFHFVKTYWFYGRSYFSYLSSFLLLAGIGGLLFSLLDIRGPEEKVKVEVPTERTIILIDTSASMLAEDVKPSRLQKASLIAKHFARKAAGQQLSIVAFAEIQKKIVPFTTDLDLIDARLDSIKSLRNQYGSSALTLAIQESIQYFQEQEGYSKGNILVLTDGEETADGIDLKIPKDVRLALVGIGTEQGGRIPLDDGRGFRYGYKKERGRDIITKINENFFKKVASDVPNGKYWLANSYTLPSEEIIEFFRGEAQKGDAQQDMVIKPVLMEWIVIPSLILIILSYLFKSLRIFTLGLFLLITPVKAQEEKQEPQLTPEIIHNMDRLQKGELNQVQKLKLADDLHKAGAKEEALSLYKENLPPKVDPKLPAEAYLNYGTSLLEKGDVQNALAEYEKLSKSLDSSTKSNEIKDLMEKNIVSFFAQQEQKKKEEQQKKDNKDQKDKKDQKDPQDGSGQKNQQGSGSGKDQKDQKESKAGDEKDKGKSEENNKDEKKDDQEKDQENKEQNKEEGKEQKPMPQKKVPAKLKQLMSDDRQLQMKMIENGTRDLNRRKSRSSKDW